MTNILFTFLIGLAFGLTCGQFNLPIPAPPTVAGVMGILGVCMGFWLIKGIAW